MSHDTQTLLQDRLLQQRDTIEDSTTDIRSMDVLSVDYEVSHDMTVTEVSLTLSYGGPTVTVECLSGRLRGQWGLESHTIPVDSQDLGQYGRELASRFEDRIQS